MQRDMDLIRKLLLEIEHMGLRPIYNPRIDGFSKELNDYNLYLLINHGLVEGNGNRFQGGDFFLAVFGLTMDGHDFLDAVRAKSVWERTKRFVQEGGLQSAPLTVIKEIAVQTMKDTLGLI